MTNTHDAAGWRRDADFWLAQAIEDEANGDVREAEGALIMALAAERFALDPDAQVVEID